LASNGSRRWGQWREQVSEAGARVKDRRRSEPCQGAPPGPSPRQRPPGERRSGERRRWTDDVFRAGKRPPRDRTHGSSRAASSGVTGTVGQTYGPQQRARDVGARGIGDRTAANCIERCEGTKSQRIDRATLTRLPGAKHRPCPSRPKIRPAAGLIEPEAESGSFAPCRRCPTPPQPARKSTENLIC
jgi:hypothetical protein